VADTVSLEKPAGPNQGVYKNSRKNKKELLDYVLIAFLTAYAFLIIVPFYNVVVSSFLTQREFLERTLVLWPRSPTLESYAVLLRDGRILVGYRSTLLLLATALPVNMFLTTSLAYGLAFRDLPGKKIILMLMLFTMLFSGGIIPIFLVMRELQLINTIWSVVFASGVNTFYFIIMRNYFLSLPDSLMESARLDGANEWKILYSIVLPLSKPIIATMLLFYAVDRWNEWFLPMIFIRRTDLTVLQVVLRSIVMDAQMARQMQAQAGALVIVDFFADGMRMAAVLVTMLPIMLVFPFLQKHFAKGVLVGAIKA